MRSAFLGLCCGLLILPVHANVVTIAKSTSPDGSYYITIDHTPDPAERGDLLQIRSMRTKDVLASFEWDQFYPNVSADSAQVLWKPDSRAFATNTLEERHFSGSQVFALRDKHWIELDIPLFDPPLDPRQKWSRRGRGGYVASAWLGRDILRMNFDEEIYSDTQLAPAYWVDLRLVQDSKSIHLEISNAEEQKQKPN